jgi:hypothetical protein
MIDLDAVIPKAKVTKVASTFLEQVDFRIEIAGRRVIIPRDIELMLWTRAFIKQDDVTGSLGNHYEAALPPGGLREKFGTWPE